GRQCRRGLRAPNRGDCHGALPTPLHTSPRACPVRAMSYDIDAASGSSGHGSAMALHALTCRPRQTAGKRPPIVEGGRTEVRIVDLSRELYHRAPQYPGQPTIIHGVWKTHEEAFAESGNVQGNSVMYFTM